MTQQPCFYRNEDGAGEDGVLFPFLQDSFHAVLLVPSSPDTRRTPQPQLWALSCLQSSRHDIGPESLTYSAPTPPTPLSLPLGTSMDMCGIYLPRISLFWNCTSSFLGGLHLSPTMSSDWCISGHVTQAGPMKFSLKNLTVTVGKKKLPLLNH